MASTLETRGMTAMHRAGLSRPVALALDDGLIPVAAGLGLVHFGGLDWSSVTIA